MPDGLTSSSSNFIQSVDQGHDTQLSVTNGGTVIFDSYSPEHEVRRRNLKTNNVSKLNHMPNRFPTDFNVRVRADSVAAILCAETVSDYKVVDKKSGQTITATDKRPDYMKTAHKVNAKRSKHSELEVKALIEGEDTEQTHYFHRAPPLDMRALTGNEEAIRQYYNAPCTTAPHHISYAFNHPGLPSCLLDASGTLCPLSYSPFVYNFKHPVKAADKSYKETVGIMNFTSSSTLSSTGLGERCVGEKGNRPSTSLLTKQQPEPILNVNMLLVPRTTVDIPSSKDAQMLLDIPDLIDFSNAAAILQGIIGNPATIAKVAANSSET